MSIPVSDLERRLSAAVVVASAAIFAGLLFVAQPPFPSFDEAKYIGIGYRFLAGEGPRTLFGALFTPHSPLWPVITAAPDVWFGIDPLVVGRLLNAVAGVGLLALVAAFGWPVRPAVAALAVASLVAFWYLHDLTRTARLDVPVAALCLLYVWVGVRAVRSGRVATAIAMGAIFAIAFLIKEIALPLAPVPFLIGILERRSPVAMARTLAIVVLVAAIGTSWWFLTIAQATGRVYRLGTPAWTLVPLTLLAIVVVVAGLAAGPIADRLAARRASATAPLGDRATILQDRGPTILAWGLGVAWFTLLTVFFARQDELKGNSLFEPRQYALYLQEWFPSGLAQVLAVLLGGVVGVGLLVRGDRATRMALAVPALALLCSAPLILLVVAVGEPPRNYLAQIGLLAAIAAAGWWATLAWMWHRLARRSAILIAAVAGAILGALAAFAVAVVVPGTPRPAAAAIGAVAGAAIGAVGGWVVRRAIADGHRGAIARGGLGAILLGSLAVATVILGVHVARERESASTATTSEAIRQAADWIETNVPPGTPLGFGSFSSYNLALELKDRYPMSQIDQVLAVYDPDAPYGLAGSTDARLDDWIALDDSRRALEFYAFHGSQFADTIKRQGIGYYVYLTLGNTSVPALVGALTPEHGFEPVASWEWPPTTAGGRTDQLAAHIFRVNPDRVDFGSSRLHVPPTVLAHLVELLEADGARAATAAGNLAERIEAVPPSSETAALLERLRRLAGS